MVFSTQNLKYPRVLSLVLMTTIVGSLMLLTAQIGAAQTTGPDLSGSSKTVDKTEAMTGEELQYTITISNSGDATASSVVVTDSLPAGVSYISGTLAVPAATGVIVNSSGISGTVISWDGVIQAGSEAVIRFSALVTGSAAIPGDSITNTVEIAAGVTPTVRSVATAIISETVPVTKTIYMPVTVFGLEEATELETSGTRFNSTTVEADLSWSLAGAPAGASYIVEESTDADFTTVTSSEKVTGTTYTISKDVSSAQNVYYYRVKLADYPLAGAFYSNIVGVVIVPSDIEVSYAYVAEENGEYGWALSWDAGPGTESLSFDVEESRDATFGSGVTTYTANGNSLVIRQPASTDNVFYYRVRLANFPNGEYSDVLRVIGAYRDDFETETGDWEMRREDFDDTENVMSYTDGNLKMHVRGRWDYMITSPLRPAPDMPYRIKTRVKFDGPGNLNTYGVVFNGDWTGQTCPSIFPDSRLSDQGTSTLVEYEIAPTADDALRPRSLSNVDDNCFNAYYRNILLWFTGAGEMRSSFKRIQYHDDNNSGRGDFLQRNGDWKNISLQSGDANGWNEWTWEVYPNGEIHLYSGTDLKYVARDNEAVYTNRFFGLWASTDEYPGSDPLYDYLLVEPIVETEVEEE